MSFFTKHEYNTNLFLESKKVMILTEQVNIIATEIQKLYKELKQNIKFLLHRSAFYHSKHYTEASMLKERNKVYLLQKNIKITRSSKKLNYIKIESFKIIRNIKNVSFKLDLSEKIKRKHSVFYIFLLKSALKKVLVLKQVSDHYFIKQEE